MLQHDPFILGVSPAGGYEQQRAFGNLPAHGYAPYSGMELGDSFWMSSDIGPADAAGAFSAGNNADRGFMPQAWAAKRLQQSVQLAQVPI